MFSGIAVQFASFHQSSGEIQLTISDPVRRQIIKEQPTAESKALSPGIHKQSRDTEIAKSEYRQALSRLESFATWMDSQYTIPGTSIRFGWDMIIGLIPVLGDLLTFFLSGYVLREAKRLGAPRGLIRKMILNIVIDFVGGLIPVFGDIFDLFYRSSTRNLNLLKDYLVNQIDPPVEPRPIPWVWLSLILAALVLLMLYLLSTPPAN